MSNLVEIRKQLIEPKALAQFRMALPAHIPPERFQRAALTALTNSPDIGQCTKESVFNALMKCAQDGLIPDNREAAIVKYGQVATYMPMVYGLIKRMRNSGEVKSVNAYIVYANDVFDYEIINGVQNFRHKPCLEAERGEMILTYAVITLADGTPHVEVMMRADIEKARNAGKASQGPAWKNWYEEMAKKTVIHRAAKRVPTSSDVEKLLARDTHVMLNGSDDEDGDKSPKLIDAINAGIELEVSGAEVQSTTIPETEQQAQA
jgi:recombination protein RecT